MWLIAVAWMYVVLMMAVAEATASNGSVLGAVFTFVLYGLLPLGIVLYIGGAPGRRKKRLAQEALETQTNQQSQANPPSQATATENPPKSGS